MIHFLIALCKENRGHACHVVRIPSRSYKSEFETEEPPPIGIAQAILQRPHPSAYAQHGDRHQQ